MILVNALTIPNIVHVLRLDRTSELIKQTMIQMIKELKIKQNEMIRSLKKNPILATADWLFVQKAIDIQSPFDDKKEELIKENLVSRRHIDMVKCDHCQAYVTVPVSKFEFKQTFEDCRIRILRLAILSLSSTLVRTRIDQLPISTKLPNFDNKTFANRTFANDKSPEMCWRKNGGLSPTRVSHKRVLAKVWWALANWGKS